MDILIDIIAFIVGFLVLMKLLEWLFVIPGEIQKIRKLLESIQASNQYLAAREWTREDQDEDENT